MPALDLLKSRNIPVVFNTSKTLDEALHLQHKIGIDGPVIIENGSAIAVRSDARKTLSPYFPTECIQTKNELSLIKFGCERKEILQFIESQRTKLGNILEGYNDWNIDLISQRTGLSLEEAKISANKRYSEPFIWTSNEQNYQSFKAQAEKENLKILQGGRFFHLQGQTNKAKPLNWLCNTFKKLDHNKVAPKLICLGDNKNDIDMLNIADHPVCVKSPTTEYPKIHKKTNTIFTKRYGPEGWNDAIFEILGHDTH